MARDDSTRLKERPKADPRPPGRLERFEEEEERFGSADGRKFGFTLGGAFLGLCGLLVWRGHLSLASAAGVLGGVLVLAGLVVPARLEPVWRSWMALAKAISKVTTPVIMGLIYYLLITPVGLIRRIAGRNPLEPDGRDGTYWVRRTDGGARRDFHRPF